MQELATDPSLEAHKRGLIVEAARQLKAAQVPRGPGLCCQGRAACLRCVPVQRQPAWCFVPAACSAMRMHARARAHALLCCIVVQMAVFDERSGNLYVTELGRVASHFYIRCMGCLASLRCIRARAPCHWPTSPPAHAAGLLRDAHTCRHLTMVTFNELMKPHMTEAEVLSMVAQSSEFESMMVREVGGPPPAVPAPRAFDASCTLHLPHVFRRHHHRHCLPVCVPCRRRCPRWRSFSGSACTM